MSSELKFVFTVLPAIGHEVNDRGFIYVVTGAQPHINRDNTPSMKVTWKGCCAECGEAFTFATGSRVYSFQRRCRDHKMGWKRATPFKAVEPMAGREEVNQFLEAFSDHIETLYGRETPERRAVNQYLDLLWEFFNVRFEPVQAVEASDLLQ